MNSMRMDKERGSMLVMAVVLSFALFITGLSYLKWVDTFQKKVSNEVSTIQAEFARSAGFAFAREVIESGSYDDGFSGRWRDWYLKTVYKYDIFPTGYDDFMYGGHRGYVIKSYGNAGSYGSDIIIQRSGRQSYIKETFADYLYLTDREVDTVRHDIIRFWTPDTLDGKVHSNDTLHIHPTRDRPRFMKRVTSSAPVIVPYNHHARFDEGLFLNAAPIYFPQQADEIRRYSGLRDFGTFAPDSIDSATELTFSGEMIYVRYCGPFIDPPDTVFRCLPDYIQNAQQIPIPRSGALFVNGKTFVKASRGRLDLMDGNFISIGYEGRLTVASSDTMIIPDDLIYRYANLDNSIPNDMSVIDDVLGLISENFIMVGDNVRDTVYINAAMAAINGSISIRDIYRYGTYNEKQSLFIYGSLAQRNRGIVRTTYQGTRGFIEKDYHYDERLMRYPPPHFLPTKKVNFTYTESSESDWR